LQLIYGAFIAGLKAATAAPTWPTINSVWWPQNLHSYGDHYFPGISFLFDHPLMIHFIHRNLAYIITALVIIWTWRAYRQHGTHLFKKTRWIPAFLVLLQLILGILTVLNSVNADKFLWLAVAHQFIAMLFLLSLFFMLYIIRVHKNVNE
jgi:cytochrome c oxidase assembly protein subunit 15